MNTEQLKERYNTFYLSRPLLNGLFTMALLVLLVVTFYSHKQVNDLIESNKRVAHTFGVLQKIDSSLYKIISLESDQRAYLIMGNERFLIDIDANKADLNSDLDALKQLTKDNTAQNARVIRFISFINKRLDIIQKVLQLKSSNKLNTPEATEWLLEGQDTSLRVRSLGQEIKSVEMILLNERNQSLVKHAASLNTFFIVGNIISILSLIIALFLINRELKIRRTIEIQNQIHQTRLRKIIESASDMIAAFDKNCQFIIFNEAYQREFKLIFDKSINTGMKLDEALPTEHDIESISKSWKNTLHEDNSLKTLEIIVKGVKQVYEISVNLIYDENNEFNGAVQSIRNITKRIEEHTELQQSYEKLEQGMQALQEKNKQITLLVDMSDIMLASNSQEELSDVMSKYSAKLLKFASGYLYVMHPSKNYLEIISRWGQPTSQETTFTPEQCWAIRLGRKHHMNGSNQSELICSHIHLNEAEEHACIRVPLMAQNDIYGLLYLEIKKDEVAEDENDKLLINAFAELAALALANVRLRENLRHQSIRDPLTGLYNRRYLEDFLFKQTHQAERTKSNFSVLMLDLDHFKKVNDNYGHDAGDAVLKELGHILQDAIRIGDIASRYGGEEFVVAFYNMDYKTTLARAESIRQAVLRANVRYGAQHVGSITVSIGVAMFPSDGRTPAELIDAADKALYFAKHNGRNRVMSFSDMKKDEE